MSTAVPDERRHLMSTATAEDWPTGPGADDPVPYILAEDPTSTPGTLQIGRGRRYRLFMEWESERAVCALPRLASDEIGVAIAMARQASSFRGVRYVAVYDGDNAYPVALVIGGQDMDWDLEDALAFMG
jgi:hypothetical protein